jgi:hypothetical protein
VLSRFRVWLLPSMCSLRLLLISFAFKVDSRKWKEN